MSGGFLNFQVVSPYSPVICSHGLDWALWCCTPVNMGPRTSTEQVTRTHDTPWPSPLQSGRPESQEPGSLCETRKSRWSKKGRTQRTTSPRLSPCTVKAHPSRGCPHCFHPALKQDRGRPACRQHEASGIARSGPADATTGRTRNATSRRLISVIISYGPRTLKISKWPLSEKGSPPLLSS